MKSRIIIFIFAALLCNFSNLYAQNDYKREAEIAKLKEQKTKVTQEEKKKLKVIVEKINERLDNNEITAAEAQQQKEAAANKHALNIENRIEILNNKIALIERNEVGYLEIEEESSVSIFGVELKNSESKDRVKYDRRTYKDLVVAFGINNALTSNQSLGDSDFKLLGSRFFEIGWAWKTRVFKNSNWLRINYGISYVSNSFKPTDNRYYVENGNRTELEEFRVDLKKSKFRMDNLVVPLYFEFGGSKATKKPDIIRYDTDGKFRIGVGGYLGANIGSRQKLKYRENGERVKDKIIKDYNTNDFIYGLGAYAGFGDMTLYAKYELSPIFKDPNQELNAISLGLKFDL